MSSKASNVKKTFASLNVLSNVGIPINNAQLLLGANWAIPSAIGTTTPNAGNFTSLSASSAITITVSTGTSPLSVSSETVVPNLNSSLLLGSTWASPGTIGSVTPNTGIFTTINTSGLFTSTVSTGDPPLSVSSATVVPNLNSSLLLGSTWASPGTIGSATPNTGNFTTINTSGVLTSTSTINLTNTSPTAKIISVAGSLDSDTTSTSGSISTAGGIYSGASIRAVSGFIGSTSGTALPVGYLGEFPDQTGVPGTNGTAFYKTSNIVVDVTPTTLLTFTLGPGVYIAIGSINQTFESTQTLTTNFTIGGIPVYTSTTTGTACVNIGFTIESTAVVVNIIGTATASASSGDNTVSVCRVG